MPHALGVVQADLHVQVMMQHAVLAMMPRAGVPTQILQTHNAHIVDMACLAVAQRPKSLMHCMLYALQQSYPSKRAKKPVVYTALLMYCTALHAEKFSTSLFCFLVISLLLWCSHLIVQAAQRTKPAIAP